MTEFHPRISGKKKYIIQSPITASNNIIQNITINKIQYKNINTVTLDLSKLNLKYLGIK